jgi:hypothetical protein
VTNGIDLTRLGIAQAAGIGGTEVSEEIRATSGPKAKVVAPGKRYSAHNPAAPYRTLKHKHTANGADHTEEPCGEQTHVRPVKRPPDTSEVTSSSDPEWATYVAHATEKECPQCGFANGAEDVLCSKCGYELELVCPYCGATSLNYDWLTLCPSCNEPLYEQAEEEDLQVPETRADGYHLTTVGEAEEDAAPVSRGFGGIDAFVAVTAVLAFLAYVFFRLTDIDLDPVMEYGLLVVILVLMVVQRSRMKAKQH